MFQKDKSNRGRGMINKLISEHLISKEELIKFIDNDCKLLTSKDLAKVLNVNEGALRKQRSLNRIYYPADLVVKTVHNNLQDAQLRNS